MTGQDADIVRVIRRVDAVLTRHRLQPFYEDPQTHVSLFWWLGDHRESLSLALPQLQQAWDALAVTWCVQVRPVSNGSFLSETLVSSPRKLHNLII